MILWDQDKKDLMIENQELLSDMLDIAIQELEMIVERWIFVY